MMIAKHIQRTMLLLAAVFFLAPPALHAQPVLNFTRIVNNWPTIELYFKVSCDGQPAYPLNKQFYKVYENGVEVGEFTLWCPDPRQRCAISVALVFDASGSMTGPGNQAAIDGGNAFVDKMDGIIDEACIIWFTSTVHIELGMTTNKNDLHNAINALPATGGSAIWDGMYVGVQELILSGNNPCRAVIAMTDGTDTGSTHTPDDVISAANRNRIRVFTIGLGSVSPGQLETIALLTGGKYYQAPSPSQVSAIYDEITTIIYAGFLECLITYQSKCQDGGLRTVDLQLQNYCHGGSDKKSRTFRAPKDTSTYAPVDIAVGNTTVIGGQDVSVPITITTPIDNNTIWYQGDMDFSFDNPCLTFKSFDTPPGTILFSATRTVTPTTNSVHIAVSDRTLTNGMTVLGYLTFTATLPGDTIDCDVHFDGCKLENGCYRPVLHDGIVTILDTASLLIYPFENVTFCPGDSVVLTAIDGYTDYIWSTGAHGQSIAVKQAGSYWVSAERPPGHRDTSSAVVVTELPAPQPFLTVKNDTTICDGDSFTLGTTQQFDRYEWSNGAQTDQINVFKAGTYHVRVRNAQGCYGYSQSISVSVQPVPQPAIIGQFKLCGGDSLYTYRAAQAAGVSYNWSVQNGTILGDNTLDSVVVKWPHTPMATIMLEETDTATGCHSQAGEHISSVVVAPRLNVLADTVICSGSTIHFQLQSAYDSYLWSTGDTTSTLSIDSAGTYYVSVTQDQCTATSDTIGVTVLDGIPTAISGPATVCSGATPTYEATEYPNTQYSWTVTGGQLVSGQGSSSIVTQWIASTGKVIVHARMGGCTSDDTLDVAVSTIAKPDVAVLGDTVLCEGDSVGLEASAGYISYLWSNGATTRTTVVNASGDYTVDVMNSDSCTATSDPVHISVYALPQKPGITQSGNTLTCTVQAASYQWYLNSTALPGETNRTLVITQSGRYSVTVANAYGCSNISDEMVFTGLGRYAPALAKSFAIAPNPSSGTFEVAVEFARPTAYAMRIVNIAGQTVYSERVAAPAVQVRKTITLQNPVPGVYFFMLESAQGYDYRKVLIQAP